MMALEDLQTVGLTFCQDQLEVTVNTGGEGSMIASDSIPVEQEHSSCNRDRTAFIEHPSGQADCVRVDEEHVRSDRVAGRQRDSSRRTGGVVIAEGAVGCRRDDDVARTALQVVEQAVETEHSVCLRGHGTDGLAVFLQRYRHTRDAAVIAHLDDTLDLSVRRSPAFRSGAVDRQFRVALIERDYRIFIVYIGYGSAVEIGVLGAHKEGVRRLVAVFLETQYSVLVHVCRRSCPVKQHTLFEVIGGLTFGSGELRDSGSFIVIELGTYDRHRLRLLLGIIEPQV